MAIIVVLAVSYIAYTRHADPGCTGSVQLNVAAAPEIAPAVDQAAQRWVKSGAKVGETCVAVSVAKVSPADEAAAIATVHKVSLMGVGSAPSSVRVADVWISDSSTWLLRLQSEAPGFLPTDKKPVAQSPVVVAVPQPIVDRLGWQNKKPTWKDLLSQLTTGTQLRTGIVDPNRDAAGLSGLLSLGLAAGAGPQAQAIKVGALRALAQSNSSLREDLLQKFPKANDVNDIATGLSAAPLSEEDVVSYNAEKPAVPLVPLYLAPNPLPLDYPYAVMPEVEAQKGAAAAALHAQLQSVAFKNDLAAVGLRAPDGSAGTGFAAPVGAPTASASVAAAGANDSAGTAAGGLDASALSQVLGGWAAVTVPGRVLAVFDVSGSMLTPVPSAGGLTRAAVTRGAARGGLQLFDDRWSVGVWLFSTNMDGSKPYKEIVPISPLSSQRLTLQESISQIKPKANGQTGLYSTVLAAYKTVQAGWQAGKVNSVILFTDGKNQDPSGISQADLVTQLHKLNNPERPVRLVIIGIGNEVDRNELQTITSATTAGGVFVAPDPARIADIFLEAIATRTGAN